MIKDRNSLNELDIKFGHRRIYDMDTLKRHIQQAGLQIIKQGGAFVKPLSNAQFDSLNLNDKILAAYFRLGEKYPDISSNIYVVAEVR